MSSLLSKIRTLISAKARAPRRRPAPLPEDAPLPEVTDATGGRQVTEGTARARRAQSEIAAQQPDTLAPETLEDARVADLLKDKQS